MTDTIVPPRGMRVAEAWLQQIRDTGAEPDPAAVNRITRHCFRNRPCNDCGAGFGEPHDHGCDVETCQWTGMQRIACGGQSDWSTCDCEDDNGYDSNGYTTHTCGQTPHDCGSETWDGVWPASAEAIDYGWFCWFAPSAARRLGPFTIPAGKSWLRCGPEHPEAVPDLTRVHTECAWDRDLRSWVKR